MLSVGEMCLLLPNIRSNYQYITSNINNNSFKRKNSNLLSTTNLSRRLLFQDENCDDSDNENNVEFAERILNEQLKIDRERYLNRFNFDIFNCHENKTVTSTKILKCQHNLSTNIKEEIKTSEETTKFKLDENVNILEYEHHVFENQNNIKEAAGKSSVSTCEISTHSTSPTKCKTTSVVELRKHPYTFKKQTQLTDFWRMKRHHHSTTESKNKNISSKLTQSTKNEVSHQGTNISQVHQHS